MHCGSHVVSMGLQNLFTPTKAVVLSQNDGAYYKESKRLKLLIAVNAR